MVKDMLEANRKRRPSAKEALAMRFVAQYVDELEADEHFCAQEALAQVEKEVNAM